VTIPFRQHEWDPIGALFFVENNSSIWYGGLYHVYVYIEHETRILFSIFFLTLTTTV